MNTSGTSRSNTTISSRIIEKVAVQEGIDSTDLFPRLFDVIDPDALDTIYSTQPGTAESDLQVAFSYAGYDVLVYGDGRVKVAESNHRPT